MRGDAGKIALGAAGGAGAVIGGQMVASSLTGTAPTPAHMPAAGQQQQATGSLLEGGAGEIAMGAAGGTGAVTGGQTLAQGMESKVRENVEQGQRRGEGFLSKLGELGKDLGLF